MATTQPILIGYDGSANADHAVLAAGQLFPAAHAVVVHIWHMPALYVSGYAGAPAIPADVQRDVEKAAEEQATQTVERGLSLARDNGLEAEGFAYVTPSPAWRRLLGAADDVHARAIVVGSRGRGGVKSLVLGSTSQALAHHTRVPLLIVPPEAEE